MGINPRDEARSQQDNIAFALLTQEHHGSPGAQWWLLSDIGFGHMVLFSYKIIDELHFMTIAQNPRREKETSLNITIVPNCQV